MLAAGEEEHVLPVALPGGRGLLFTVWHTVPDFDLARIAVRNLETGERTFLTSGNQALYSETGHLLVVRSDGSVHGALFDTDRLETTSEFAPLFDGAAVGRSAGFDVALSRSGDLIYSGPPPVTAPSTLAWVDEHGRVEPLDSTWTGAFQDAELSPDGSRVAVTVMGNTESAIWTRSISGGTPVRLTDAENGTYNRNAVWLPDGDSLAFVSDRSGAGAVYTTSAYSLGGVRRWPMDPVGSIVDITGPTPAGALAYRSVSDGGEWDIFAQPAGSGPAIPVAAETGTFEYAPALSPDGRYLAYVTGPGESSQLWVRPFPEGDQRALVVATGGHTPAWKPDGKQLFYITMSHMVRLSVTTDPTFSVLQVDTLFATAPYMRRRSVRSYDVAADGRLLMIEQSTDDIPELILVNNFAGELQRRLPRR